MKEKGVLWYGVGKAPIGEMDGSHIRIEEGEAWLFGEGYRIRDRRAERICRDGGYIRVSL